jgi:autotransporter adhesin
LQASQATQASQISAEQANVVGLQSLTSSQGHAINTLFDLASVQREETRKGIATVTAMAQPHFPSAAGRTSYASNIGYYRGEVAVSAGMMHRFSGDFAVGGAVSFAGGDHAAVKAGAAGEF